MRRRVTIVMVMSAYQLGGTERQLASLIEHRPSYAKDFQLHTITFREASSEAIARRFEREGVRNTLVDRRTQTFLSFFFGVARTMARLKPDVVITLLDSSSGAWGRLAAWLVGVRNIVHSDQSLMVEGTRAHLFLRPFLDRVTRRFLPNAEAIAARLVRDGVRAERITVIPTAVDLGLFDPGSVLGVRDAWAVPGHAIVAGFVGRFADVKRIDILLDAMLELPVDRRPDYLVLAGDGPTMPAVRERVSSDAWLADRCILLGTIDEIPEFMASIDFLVLASRIEGLPNVVLEAMAMAKPVVATRVSDVPAVIEGCGFLAEPLDVTSLARAIGDMVALTPEERDRLGRTGRRRIERDYELDTVAKRFWDAQLELISGPPSVGVADPSTS